MSEVPEKVWEHDYIWYARMDGELPLCMNTKEAAEMYLDLRTRLEAAEKVIELLGEGFADDGEPYWWQPYNDEQLSPAQADALNKAIEQVTGKTAPKGWTSFAALAGEKKP